MLSFHGVSHALVWALLVLCTVTARAARFEDVQFAWQPGRQAKFSDNQASGELQAKLFHAPQEPAPHVIFLHGCGGLKLEHVMHWAEFFVSRGVGVLMLDSFGPRKLSQTCGEAAHWYRWRADDAEAALLWLRQQPFVKAGQIALMGQSQGAVASLLVMHRKSVASQQLVGGLALYPGCGVALNFGLQYTKPMLVMVGDADTAAPAERCEALKAAQAEGTGLELSVYPGAAHSFDNPVRYHLLLGKHVVVEHAESRDQVRQRVAAFVARWLH